MNIAIDGRVLGLTAGKAVYTRSVLEAWKANTEHQFHVYGYQPTASESWPSNWQFIPLAGRRQRLQAFRHLTEDVLFSPSSYLTTIISNRPTLTTIHDLVIYKVPVKLPLKTRIAEKFLLKKAVQASAALTVQTQSTFNDLVELFPAARTKTRVIAPGIAPAISRAALPSPSEQERLLSGLGVRSGYLLFVGTLEPRKNIVRLTQAYERLPASLRQRYQLVLAGQVGWADRALKTSLKNLPAGVRCVGRVSDQTLATLYQHARVVVYPSLYEGVGYPVLEAYYWDKPVLTSNTSSLAEIGRPAALLVDPYSVPALAEGLEKILTDEPLRHKLIAAAQNQLGFYSWPKAANAYLEIFNKIA